MQVRVISDAAEFERLRPAWDRLLDESDQNYPFFSWAWYWTWWKCFGGDNRLFLVCGQDSSGELCFVAPFMIRRAQMRGAQVSELSFANSPIGPRNGILVSRYVPAEVAARGLAQVLLAHQREWDVARLVNLERESPALESLRRVCNARGLGLAEEPARASPYVALPASFDEYLKRFKRKHRYNIGRSVRRLCDHEGGLVSCYSDPENLQEGLRKAFAVSGESWKAKTGSDMAGNPARKAFYQEVTAELGKLGKVRIYALEMKSRPIAIQYLLESHMCVHLLCSDFDEHYRRFEPGNVLLYSVLRRLIAEGIGGFDFCGEAYRYKMRWATEVRNHVTLWLFNRRLYSRLLYFGKVVALPAWHRIRGTANDGTDLRVGTVVTADE